MLSKDSSPEPGALFSAIKLSGQSSIVAAVSGGGDSLALLFLLQEHLRSIPDAPSLVAVTVDHGLRAQSAEEARMVGQLAADRGIAHEVLRWEGPKPSTGLSAAARDARFDLLAKAAREAGSDVVLTGHTADDQAETLAMRLARGEGRGTAGIAPGTLCQPGGDGVWFVRPLLGVRREALRSYLRARGLAWIEDPTNRDRRFERARLRQELSEKAIQDLLAQAKSAAAARQEAGREAAELIAGAATKIAPGLLRMRADALEEAGKATAIYVLRILLAIAGGVSHLPDEKRTAALLAGAEGAKSFRASLSRAVATKRGGYLYLHRERRNLPENPLEDGLAWDGRYLVSTARQGNTTIAPLGAEHVRTEDLSGVAPANLVRAALSAEPALWQGARCLRPAAEARDILLRPLAGPWARLLPSFDFVPARAGTELLGAKPLPPPPWRGHKET